MAEVAGDVPEQSAAALKVLLGGLESLSGPIAGAAIFATLQDTVMRQTEYWRALLGAIILMLVLIFPGGIVGALAKAFAHRSPAQGQTP